MNDTPSHVEAKVRELLMAKSGAERMEMGARSSAVAREIALTAMPANLSPVEQRHWLFKRIYGYPWPGQG